MAIYHNEFFLNILKYLKEIDVTRAAYKSIGLIPYSITCILILRSSSSCSWCEELHTPKTQTTRLLEHELTKRPFFENINFALNQPTCNS